MSLSLNETETKQEIRERVFHLLCNWFWPMCDCWFVILQKWTHQFEDVSNTQTHQATKREDDERWKEVYQQTSIRYKNELLSFEVMWNMRESVNMWTTWIHIRRNICEDDIETIETKSKELSTAIYQKNYHRCLNQLHTASKRLVIQSIRICFKSKRLIWKFEQYIITTSRLRTESVCQQLSLHQVIEQ